MESNEGKKMLTTVEQEYDGDGNLTYHAFFSSLEEARISPTDDYKR